MLLVAGLVLIGAASVEPVPFDSRAQTALAQDRLPAPHEERYLYVALPGPGQPDADRSVRILGFDITTGHRLVKRTPVCPPASGEKAHVVGATTSTLLTLHPCT